MPAGGGPISWSALQTLASALASVNSANAVSVPTFAKMISDARAEYWASEAQPANQWRSVIYSVLCAPEPQAKLEALMPSNHELTIEEWLWHRLCMVRAQLIEEAPSAALASSHQPLVGLQSLLYERLGEGHFNKGRQSPLLFASVLFHSLQLERAIAFLYTQPEYSDEAVHLALALHHAKCQSHCLG